MSTPRTPEELAKARERYARYRQTEKYRETQRRYRSSDKWKRAQSVYGKYARENTPAQVGARKAVAIAVSHGALVKPTECGRCGMIASVQAHHTHGYALQHWFDVTWLCPSCHKDAHWQEWAKAA